MATVLLFTRRGKVLVEGAGSDAAGLRPCPRQAGVTTAPSKACSRDGILEPQEESSLNLEQVASRYGDALPASR